MNQENSGTYKKAGVDIDAGNKLVDKIKPLAKSTARLGIMSDIGGFGALFDLKPLNYKDPILVSSTDGVGTKLKVAIESGIHDFVGIDLVAMCVNDLIVQGAEPLFFLDYFASGKLEVEIATKVIAGIAKGCKLANCALIGGETAEMPGMYQEKDYDLAGFSVGVVERNNILPQKNMQEGDVLIGLKSSGVHSNGFSLVRYILDNLGIDYSNKAPFADKTFAEILLEPTRIYVRSCLAAIRTGKVKALAHITGGGLIENIPRVLTEELAVEINSSSWTMPPIFQFLSKAGNVSQFEMMRTFNSGIGMVLVVADGDQQEIMTMLEDNGEEVFEIGKIIKRTAESVVIK